MQTAKHEEETSLSEEKVKRTLDLDKRTEKLVKEIERILPSESIIDIARNLSVIFGFFFVFLSAILGLIPVIVTWSNSVRLLTYFVVWMMSASMFFIGLELFTDLTAMEVGKFGRYGFWILVLIGVLSYNGLVGIIILSDIEFYSPLAVLLGLLSFIILEAIVSLDAYRLMRKLSRFEDEMHSIKAELDSLEKAESQTED